VSCVHWTCLVDVGLLVKGEASVDLGRDTARDDLEDLLAELDKLARFGGQLSRLYVRIDATHETVDSVVDLRLL
jgi:hypothetical protein